MGDSGGRSRCWNVDRNVDRKDDEASGGSRESIKNQARCYLYYTLAKKMVILGLLLL